LTSRRPSSRRSLRRLPKTISRRRCRRSSVRSGKLEAVAKAKEKGRASPRNLSKSTVLQWLWSFSPIPIGQEATRRIRRGGTHTLFLQGRSPAQEKESPKGAKVAARTRTKEKEKAKARAPTTKVKAKERARAQKTIRNRYNRSREPEAEAEGEDVAGAQEAEDAGLESGTAGGGEAASPQQVLQKPLLAVGRWDVLG
jgi:hypothetical protein